MSHLSSVCGGVVVSRLHSQFDGEAPRLQKPRNQKSPGPGGLKLEGME